MVHSAGKTSNNRHRDFANFFPTNIKLDRVESRLHQKNGIELFYRAALFTYSMVFFLNSRDLTRFTFTIELVWDSEALKRDPRAQLSRWNSATEVNLAFLLSLLEAQKKKHEKNLQQATQTTQKYRKQKYAFWESGASILRHKSPENQETECDGAVWRQWQPERSQTNSHGDGNKAADSPLARSLTAQVVSRCNCSLS